MDNIEYWLKIFAQYKGRLEKRYEFERLIDITLKFDWTNERKIERISIINHAFKESIKMTRTELIALGYNLEW